jgi:hypothetical protein
VRLAPGVYTTAFLQQFRINCFAVIEVLAEGGVHLGERQIRIVAHDFLRRPAAPKVIGHQHGYSRSRMILQPCRFVVLLDNVRISHFPNTLLEGLRSAVIMNLNRFHCLLLGFGRSAHVSADRFKWPGHNFDAAWELLLDP